MEEVIYPTFPYSSLLEEMCIEIFWQCDTLTRSMLLLTSKSNLDTFEKFMIRPMKMLELAIRGGSEKLAWFIFETFIRKNEHFVVALERWSYSDTDHWHSIEAALKQDMQSLI